MTYKMVACSINLSANAKYMVSPSWQEVAEEGAPPSMGGMPSGVYVFDTIEEVIAFIQAGFAGVDKRP